MGQYDNTDAFSLLKEFGQTNRRRKVPWAFMVLAPLSGFIGTFTILGVIEAGVPAALLLSHIVAVAVLLCWRLLEEVGLVTPYETVVHSIESSGTLFEKRRSTGHKTSVKLFIPDNGGHWKFDGHRPEHTDIVVIESVEYVDSPSQPVGTTEQPVSSVEYRR